MLLAFLLFSVIIILVISINKYYNYKKDKINTQISELNKLRSQLEMSNKAVSDFFTTDTYDTLFYSTGLSEQITNYRKINNQIFEQISSLKNDVDFKKFKVDSNIHFIQQKVSHQSKIADSIFNLVKIRGFINEGYEGQMRYYAHNLERVKHTDLFILLSLRRAEKDYFLRYKPTYLKRYDTYFNYFIDKIHQTEGISVQEKYDIFLQLYLYRHYFYKIVELDAITGTYNNDGLKQQLFLNSALIQNSIHQTEIEVENSKKNLLQNFNILYTTISLTLLIGSIIMGYIMSASITRPIRILAARMSLFVKSEFENIPNFDYKTTIPEVRNLIENYFILKKEIIASITEFKDRVEKRTEEIKYQHLVLEKQTYEIKAQNDELLLRNTYINTQNTTLEKRNADIVNSMNYALNIQHAMLPQKHLLNKYFSEGFILHLPKDIVSGDFYWIKPLNYNNKQLVVLAVADCTGHGVPGALMSMLGIATLNDVCLRKDVTTAGELLDAMRESILLALVTNDTNQKKINDGIDIAICVFNNTDNLLEFSGAYRPLIKIDTNGNLTKYKGDKMPIGKSYGNFDKFTNYKISFVKNDCFYLFTDGYSDQFGGEHLRKFSSKAFTELLEKNGHFPMPVQENILATTFANWKKDQLQIDDVLVTGIRI